MEQTHTQFASNAANHLTKVGLWPSGSETDIIKFQFYGR